MNAQRWVALGLVAAIVACIATSNLWLSPFLDEEEEVADATEEAPTSTPEPTATENPLGTPTPTPDPVIETLKSFMDPAAVAVGDEPRIVFAGPFTVIDAQHQGEGFADIFKLGEADAYVLFLEAFSVSNGPDLHVILSQTPVPRTSAETLLPDHLDLGPLLSTSGPQFYQIPPGTEINQYESVVIYSRSFNIVYTSAEMIAVRGE